ncbi:hypothetical protein KFK09_015276 [Dendrobium nobile]|uniref:Transposase n=1 Tax=Dendrobium nobile TaxID=94219 RepID=A0A8T3B4B6_DENNO|nr:hypothetical protein KFK09_015276 [Dendrobium nobile]
MTIQEERYWMYNRLLLGRKGLTVEFIQGVETFIQVASQLPSFQLDKMFRCPCSKHKNLAFLKPDDVKLDLYRRGFLPNYWIWTSHGEYEPHRDAHAGSSTAYETFHENQMSRPYEDLIFDVTGHNLRSNVEEPPNAETQKFFELLHSAQKPIWEGCSTHSELSIAVRMLSIKTEYNIPRECFNDVIGLMKETNPADNIIPSDLYRTKKLVSKLGLTATKIDCCINGCMLYYKDDAAEVTCHICNAPRFKQNSGKQRRPKKDVPYSRLFYLPIIPRLQRLYASMSSADHMRWHKEKIAKSDILSHPSDAEAWKHFDRVHPSFAAEPRNIRLGLCTDGFTPYSQTATPYSCWPVILTPYNLPPEMCMTTPFMFLTLIIPGPHNPKAKIDIYLQPLIDDLKLLWEEGVLTYDISIKQNFLLRAALLWTIGDFPAYGMLSGWSTAGKLACPYCMENSKAFTLKHGGKNTWFDCHRMFLHANHQFQRNKEAFVKNRIERSPPPPRLSGDEILQRLSNIPTIIEYPMLSESKFPGYGVQHNWIKKSIFWTLPYWRTNLIRHNLDVMHIEKNFLDNIFNTIMDVKGKSKDNVKARMDIKEFCRRKNLELVTTTDGKLMKPKAPYSFTLEQKRMICQWFKGLKMPDGYGSNISRCVDLKSARLFGLKSHDCHIIMEVLLPIIVSMLPDYISNPLIELSIFFKDLCSSKLSENALRRYEDNIPIILCKLEKIFPPGFFYSMEHLPVHLPYEARVGGPVQYRWMYPFER